MLTSLTRSINKILDAGPFGSAGIITAVALILAVFLLVPQRDRRRVKGPLVLLILHFLLVAWETHATFRFSVRQYISVVGLFVLLASIGRSAFLLFIYSFVSRKLTRPFPRIFRDLLQGLIYMIAVFMTLRAAGVAPGSLLTSSALLAAVIGLSLQDTLGNLFAGLAIQAQRPFDVGDWIQFDQLPGHTGRVVEINWRATKVLTLDQVEVTVPNGVLAKAPISNFSKPSAASRRQIQIVAPYEEQPHRVAEILVSAVRDVPGVLREPSPSALVFNFLDRGVEYNIRYFVRDFPSREQVDALVRERIWYGFRRAAIGMPFPIRTVLATEVTEEQRVREAKARLDSREETIAKVEFLKDAPKQLVERIATQSASRLYDTGEVILRQGEEGAEIYIVAGGEVAVSFAPDAQSEPIEVARLGSGDVFGEIALLTGELRSATVRATKPTELICISKIEFNEIIDAFPNVAKQVQTMLEKRRTDLAARAQDAAKESEGAHHEQRILLARIRDFFSL